MPYRDKTGPQGAGPITGRSFGLCGVGRGFGRGMGFGRGFQSWFASQSKDQVKEELAFYKKTLEEELEQVKAELKKLEGDK